MKTKRRSSETCGCVINLTSNSVYSATTRISRIVLASLEFVLSCSFHYGYSYCKCFSPICENNCMKKVHGNLWHVVAYSCHHQFSTSKSSSSSLVVSHLHLSFLSVVFINHLHQLSSFAVSGCCLQLRASVVHISFRHQSSSSVPIHQCLSSLAVNGYRQVSLSDSVISCRPVAIIVC